jgi:hypothetical protein
MAGWEAAVLALVGVVAGASLVVLAQVHTAVRQLAREVRGAAPTARATLSDAEQIVRRLRIATDGLDQRPGAVTDVVESTARLTASLGELRNASRVASAVAVAVVAAVRAFGAERVTDDDGLSETATEPVDLTRPEVAESDLDRARAAQSGPAGRSGRGHLNDREERP